MITEKAKSTPNQNSGKSTLTSLLTTNASTPTGQKTVIGTRRIIMTKGADGSTRVISQPIAGPTKSAQSDGVTSKSNVTPQKDGPQKVQIIRAPDGKITVRGLLAGQQLIQMPDGKLHVVMAGQQGITGQLVAASPVTKPIESGSSPAEVTQVKTAVEETRQTPRTTATTAQQVVVQANRQIVVQPAPQMVVQPTQQVVVAPAQQVVVQAGARAVQTVLVQGQLVPRAAAPRAPPVAPRPAPPAPRPRPAQAQQIVVNNPVLVQQIAAGKIQLATVNGQQVLIRPTGNNQAQIVAHIGQSPSTVSTAPVPSPAPAVRAAPPPLAPQPTPPPVQPQPQQQQLTEDEIVEKRLLVGQPPGTVIKTVTAQVIEIEQHSKTYGSVFATHSHPKTDSINA